MDKNLKFTDVETRLFYEMITEWADIHFIDNSEISFSHLYQLWHKKYRKEYMEECVYKIKPFMFTFALKS